MNKATAAARLRRSHSGYNQQERILSNWISRFLPFHLINNI